MLQLKVKVVTNSVSKITFLSTLIHHISNSSAPFLPKLGHVYLFQFLLKNEKMLSYICVDCRFSIEVQFCDYYGYLFGKISNMVWGRWEQTLRRDGDKHWGVDADNFRRIKSGRGVNLGKHSELGRGLRTLKKQEACHGV